MKQITVLFFATLRDHMGTKQISILLPKDAGIGELKSTLVDRNPAAAAVIEIALVSINREYAFANEFIPDGAEVALFPHVSGG
jgi:molybdopterin converting factor small subunit